MSYVTGISGNVISAASAGWAPTNGADVSAIASAYATGKQDALTFGYDDDKISAINGSALAGQGGLVTAVGTSESGITSINNSGIVDTAALRSADYSSLYVQEPLYISASGDSSYIGISGDTQVVTAVGTETAYTPDGVSDVVTSINGNYISALSADSAFQASYDEEGRELTSLASEYVVSSIASSYAESAQVVSSVDSAASMITAATYVNQINGCFLIANEAYTAHDWLDASSKLDESATADFYSTSNPSGFIDSAYVDSAVSGKVDESAIQYVAGSADATANGVLYILTGNA